MESQGPVSMLVMVVALGLGQEGGAARIKEH